MLTQGFRRMLLAGLALLAVGLLAACGKGSLALSAEDSGGLSIVDRGDVITLKLESNPTTGYGWEFVGLDGQKVISLADQSYKADSKLVGSGGVDTLKLKAAEAGEVTIELVYRRSWEKDVAPLKTFTYTITVR